MPKNTFFNLKDSKKKVIIDAAIREFSRVGFDESSIKKIIEDANIPRGSFYQYFENKEDLYLFVMHNIGMEKRKSFEKLLIENGGDIFVTFEKIFLQEYKSYESTIYHNLFKNFLSHSKDSIRQKINGKRYLDNDNHLTKIFQLINTKLYDIKDDDSMKMLITTLFTSMHHVIMHADNQNLNKEEAFDKYKNFIDMFKYGVVKRD